MHENPNNPAEVTGAHDLDVTKSERNTPAENTQDGLANTDTPPPPVNVRLTRAASLPSPGDLGDEKIFWTAIRNRTEAISFDNYASVVDAVLCCRENPSGRTCRNHNHDQEFTPEIGSPSIQDQRDNLLERLPTIYGVDTYDLLKLVTQAFLLVETGIIIRRPSVGGEAFIKEERNRYGDQTIKYRDPQNPDDPSSLAFLLRRFLGSDHKAPYLSRIVDALVSSSSRREGSPFCEGLLQNRFSCPSMIELIGDYWREEGMLVQTMNAIALRFQNKRGPSDPDPLANLEIDPLRPLSNLLWGFVQDENNRLTVARRAYEYDHQYGLRLYGKAVPYLRSADSRSNFLEAFHNLLYRASLFYREDADTTVIADGYQLMHALREVHLTLAEGAHNQYSDLQWTTRSEMLMMEWLLARPEMREFLRGRAMVPYNERWMGQVDTMKKLQGWLPDISITYFRDLAIYGEQILLSVRFGDWIAVNDQDQAKTWARYWRPEIQGYIHAYMTATGVDLSHDVVDTRNASVRYAQPSALLRNRLLAQKVRAGLPAATAARALSSGEVDFSAAAGFRRRRLNPAGGK